MEPWRVCNSIQVYVGSGWEAILIRLWRQDIENGQQEADKPATTHAKQNLEFVIKNRKTKNSTNTKNASLNLFSVTLWGDKMLHVNLS